MQGVTDPLSRATGTAARRLRHIDIARGLSIALVVFSHGALRHQLEAVNTVLASFRMPLFFLLAGLFLQADVAALAWLRRRSDALLKPYAVTLLAYCLLRWLAGRHDPARYYLGLLEGNGQSLPESFLPLWFLPHLWLVLVAAWALLRWVRLPRWPAAGQLLALAALLTTGVAWLQHTTPLPWGIDLVLVSGSFVLAGVLLREPVLALGDRPVAELALLLVGGAGVLVCMHLIGPSSIDLNMRRWDDPLRSTLAAGGGILATLALAGLMAQAQGRTGRLLAGLGRHSLVILLLHYIVQAHAWKWLDAAWPAHPGWAATGAYLLGLTLPVALERAMDRRPRRLTSLWLPVRAGRERDQAA